MLYMKNESMNVDIVLSSTTLFLNHLLKVWVLLEELCEQQEVADANQVYTLSVAG